MNQPANNNQRACLFGVPTDMTTEHVVWNQGYYAAKSGFSRDLSWNYEAMLRRWWRLGYTAFEDEVEHGQGS